MRSEATAGMDLRSPENDRRRTETVVGLLDAGMNAVLLGDRDELLLDVVAGSDTAADPIDLGQVGFFESKAVRLQRLARRLEQPPPELRVLDRAANDCSDHLVTHVFLLPFLRSKGEADGRRAQTRQRRVTSVSRR